MDLPEYYFRIRENGAAVFRVDTQNRQNRIELEQIAVVNIRNGEVKAQAGRILSDADLEEIRRWTQERQALLATRSMDDIHKTVDRMNLTAQWAQSRATDAELENVTDALLMAIHDLRTVLVRKKAGRAARDD